MGVKYLSVIWNKQKKRYDLLLWLGILIFIASTIVLQFLLYPNITIETIIIRVTALTSFFLLHIILMIGPLARLDNRFLPLLYNRRHLGVSMFLISLIHAIFCIVQFHTLGDTNPLLSIFTSNQNYRSISDFPFQTLGFFALIILFFMGITSHDFWLKNLGPKIWKSLHMGVYVAYGLIIMHVATGALQYESHSIYWIVLLLGFFTVVGLHIVSGIRENRQLAHDKKLLKENGFYNVGEVSDISENCAQVFFIGEENIAVFKYDGKVSAVNNVCKHQMGPLGEGKIVDGCITCPWHGYQYLPGNGQSPPPFTEKIKTYNTKIIDGHVWVNPIPKEEGTFVEPSRL